MTIDIQSLTGVYELPAIANEQARQALLEFMRLTCYAGLTPDEITDLLAALCGGANAVGDSSCQSS